MNAIVLSGTSDIAKDLIKKLREKGYNVFATYNTSRPDYSLLPKDNWFKLKISDYQSIAFHEWIKKIAIWDLFISCIGTQKPVGKVTEVVPKEWAEGVIDNSVSQLAAFLKILPFRNNKIISTAIFFAGGGTNNPTPYYSSQTLGKVSLIKGVELLDDELENVKVTILGPGWVKTKIHSTTLLAKEKVGENHAKTIFMLENPQKMNPISKVVEDLFKIIDLPKDLVGGRNFSSVHDNFDKKWLTKLKKTDNDFYKLRRLLNNI